LVRNTPKNKPRGYPKNDQQIKIPYIARNYSRIRVFLVRNTPKNKPRGYPKNNQQIEISYIARNDSRIRVFFRMKHS
jgi:hypothetical protein